MGLFFSDTPCKIVAKFGTALAPHFSDRIQKSQNRAARVITGRKNEHDQLELALDELKWKPLSERRTQFVASLM